MPVHGKFTYTTDTPGQGGKNRVLSFEGPLARRAKSKKRPTAPSPLLGNTARFLKDEQEDDLGLIGFENGHLIPLDLGGPNDSCNIAPMFSYFNQVIYREIENAVSESTAISHMKVTVTYRDDLLAIPCKFKVRVKRSGGWVNFKTLAMQTETPKPFPIPSGDTWTPIVDLIRTKLPKAKTDTPYAFLEDLRDGMGLAGSKPTTKFNTKERTIIMIANALYDKAAGRNGFLRSDMPQDDVFDTLVRMGGTNRPQVDHILPKSWRGSNSFANAQLVSLKYNKAKLAGVSDKQRKQALANAKKQPKRKVNEGKSQPPSAKHQKTAE